MGLSRLLVKNGRITEQPFEAGVTARRSVEGRDKGLPLFCIEREDSPVRQPLFSFSQSRFENELAHGLARRRRSSLQRLFRRFAEPQIEFFAFTCPLGSHFRSLPNLSDNVKTNCLPYFGAGAPSSYGNWI